MAGTVDPLEQLLEASKAALDEWATSVARWEESAVIQQRTADELRRHVAEHHEEGDGDADSEQ